MASPLLVLALFASVALFAARADENIQKVQVTIYYESLCPDSQKFITTQLYPTWNSKLGSYMNVTLVPYGKSSYKKSADGGYTFECHHGPKECNGNKVQACALKDITSQDVQIKYINCAMENGKKDASEADYPLVLCAGMLKIPADNIRNCVNSTEGDEALVQMGEKTDELQPKLTSVPTIVFNNVVDSKDQSLAVTDFAQALCSKIDEGNRPTACPSAQSTASSVSAAFFPFLAALLLSRV